MNGKVFGIGMFKTGTTSLGQALEILGYKTSWRFVRHLPSLLPYMDLDTGKFRPFEADIRARLGEFDAFTDAPWLYLYRELDAWCPGSRFILTLRPSADEVARSDLAMWRRIGLMGQWLDEVGEEPTPEMFIDRYERHNARALEHFRGRPKDLLVVCLDQEPDPWRRICSFLGHATLPSVPFPHANRAPTAP